MKLKSLGGMLTAAVCAGGMLLAGSAHASLMQIDLNSLVADAGETFDGASHTGTISFSTQANSLLNSVQVNDIPQPFTGALSGVAGSISLFNGMVTGGNFTVDIDDGSSLMVSITGGMVISDGAGGFFVPMSVSSYQFNGSSFAGIDISSFPAGLDGDMVLFDYIPNSNGFDNQVNIDLFIVPAPGALALLVGAALVGPRRRRSH